MKELYLVSRCLLGGNCKYNGGNNRDPDVIEFCEGKDVFPVCPEVRGGLPTPRIPSEIRGDRVVNREGTDVTEAFTCGASLTLADAEAFAEKHSLRIAGAVLKANSPSCGAGTVYDGTFTGTLTHGDGVFAALLRRRGIPVRTEQEIASAAGGPTITE